MRLNFSCIVEGHGEVSAVPILLRRIQQQCKPNINIHIEPIRIPRHKLPKKGELEKAVVFAANKVESPRAVLILIDADDDCPAKLGPQLLARARLVRPDVPIGVVLAKHEFEAWFLAALGSLKGKRGLTDDLTELTDPEAVSGAKEYLTQLMPSGCAYSPTRDQPALTALFDMKLARTNSGSFDKCWREIERLFAKVSQSETKK